MKYVIDASVPYKWLVREPFTDKALLLRDDYRNGIHQLLAPDFFPVEVTHSLTRAERQGRITISQGGLLFTDFFTILPLLNASLPLLPQAYAISSAMRFGVYDCISVVLAEQEKCQLVTADDKLLKVLQTSYPRIIHLSSLP